MSIENKLSFDLIENDQPELFSHIANQACQIEPWKSLSTEPEKLVAYYHSQSPDLIRFHLQMDGATAGLVCLRQPWLRGVYIEHFLVLPGFQGMGIGKAFLRHIESKYQTQTNNLWLLVSAFNQPARKFYTSQGFIEIGPIRDFIKPGMDEILMRKLI